MAGTSRHAPEARPAQAACAGQNPNQMPYGYEALAKYVIQNASADRGTDIAANANICLFLGVSYGYCDRVYKLSWRVLLSALGAPSAHHCATWITGSTHALAPRLDV